MRSPQKIPFRSTHAFTEFFLRYIEQDVALQPFYSRFPAIKNFKQQINEKSASFPSAQRKILVESLRAQYKNISRPPKPVQENLEALLQPNAFTVTTGHQLNIFTGPLYFIYKIVTVINVCRQLAQEFPQHKFIPVYWMASEDHDYEEIKSIRLYGKKYTWVSQQQGAVGRFNPKELESVLKELPGDVSVFSEAYLKNKSLSDAARSYVNALFGEEGLIVVDADQRDLKRVLQPVMRDDIFQHIPFHLVTETNRELEGKAFVPQVNPREINFFFLDKSLRSRIEKNGQGLAVVDTDIRFEEADLRKVIDEEPEKLSPNVILRPLYQEMILPNLTYVGGPAELVYWLELKKVFDHYKTPFPILMPRNFAMIVDAPNMRKISRTGLEIQDFFEEQNYLFNHWVVKNSAHELSLGEELKSLDALLIGIRDRCTRIDRTLEPMVQAETKRMKNALEKIEKKMLRAERRLHSDRLRQIEAVKSSLFPGSGLQERVDNFLNFYQQDPDFINKLLTHLDPFDFQFNVLSYHDETGTS